MLTTAAAMSLYRDPGWARRPNNVEPLPGLRWNYLALVSMCTTPMADNEGSSHSNIYRSCL